MSGLLEGCKACFGTQDLYGVLQVTAKATDNELKKAYHKVSLKVHPDRVDDGEKHEATRRFQTLGRVYCILADPDQRALYDDTGEVDEENLAPEDKDWSQYWRLLFKKITLEDIKNFETEYKESEEELADLKQAYMDGKGSMDYILDNVLCCTLEDEPRFNKILQGWIKKKEVPGFDGFTKETKRKKESRKRKAKAEEAEAEEMKKELGLNDTADSLQALILERNKKRAGEMDSFLDSLAAKYGGAAGTKSKKKSGKK
ncbi:DnaJ subfamily C member 9 [Chionoecetes opilio]|uniref:DnaJ subfamily C member 9 n=1 Tax=Chionoecetes opilio TaxID=41210 RepID=A0A8J4YH44_CHIOP|nr:DnaJ subfamily C member 9 [Chionoecetes opilio]